MTTWGDRMDDAARAAGNIPWTAQAYRDRAHDASALQRAARDATEARRVGAGAVVHDVSWSGPTTSMDLLREFAVLRDTVLRVENALRAEHVDETTILRVVRRMLTGSPDAPESRAPCTNPEFHGNPFRYCACGWVES